jgi:hypothetical protein
MRITLVGVLVLLAALCLCHAQTASSQTIVLPQLPCLQNYFKNEVATLPATPAPIGSIFQNMTTHVAIVTRTVAEYQYQINSFLNAGIGPWSTPVTVNGTAQYCGQDVPFNMNITLSTSRAQGYGFYEIFLLLNDEPNVFRDWYNVHGASIPYQGAETNVDVTLDQFLEFLDQQRIEDVFHFNIPVSGGKNAYWIRVGYSLMEVVFINP